jgi:hypothetical protein
MEFVALTKVSHNSDIIAFIRKKFSSAENKRKSVIWVHVKEKTWNSNNFESMCLELLSKHINLQNIKECFPNTLMTHLRLLSRIKFVCS